MRLSENFLFIPYDSYNIYIFLFFYKVLFIQVSNIINLLDLNLFINPNINLLFLDYNYIFLPSLIISYNINLKIHWILMPLLMWFNFLFYIFTITLIFSIISTNISFYNKYYLKFNLLITIWITNGITKTDSTEETLCLSMLWPWCIILIFSHTIRLTKFSNDLSLAEWSIPVIYGFLLILNNMYSLGSFFLVFLTGSKTRRSLIITFFEDLLALFILFLRVLLQIIRGVIIGLFHWICRELLFNLRSWWTFDIILTNANPSTKYNHYLLLIFIFLFLNITFTFYSFLVITSIMFLQLIFLLIAIWLFCKCWFIATTPIVYNLNDNN